MDPIAREATFEVDDMGIWSLTAPGCPANPLREAMGDKPWSCGAGATTNAQGPILLDVCEFAGDTKEDCDGKIVVMCSFCAPEAKERT